MRKTCSKCKVEKSGEDFSHDGRRSDGLQSHCKACKATAKREDYAKDPKRYADAVRKSYRKHHERALEYHRRYREKNSEVIRKRKKEYAAKHPMRLRAAHLRYKYALTLDDYARMLEEQNRKCAICHHHSPKEKRLAVDHCHDTGKVRGLLCDRCNRALGLLRECPDVLRAGAEYLKS